MQEISNDMLIIICSPTTFYDAWNSRLEFDRLIPFTVKKNHDDIL